MVWNSYVNIYGFNSNINKNYYFIFWCMYMNKDVNYNFVYLL